MPYLRLIALGLALVFFPAHPKAEELRIAFGSCNLFPQSTIWGEILNSKPDLMLFLGDNIYLGKEEFGDTEKIFSKYQKVFGEPGLAQLIREVPSFAIWDDHDVGPNNADGSDPGIGAALAAFRRFWKNPPGPAELAGSVAFSINQGPVEILMTDNRTYRQHYKRSEKPTFFGAKQLSWIEARLRESKAKLIVIASGTQVLSSDGNRESMDAYAEEQQKLLEMLSKYKRPVVFLSGDLHYGEILNRELGGREVVEVTSSPLTALVRDNKRIDARNEKHRRFVVREQNFGLLEIDTSNKKIQGKARIVSAYGKELVKIDLAL